MLRICVGVSKQDGIAWFPPLGSPPTEKPEGGLIHHQATKAPTMARLRDAYAYPAVAARVCPAAQKRVPGQACTPVTRLYAPMVILACAYGFVAAPSRTLAVIYPLSEFGFSGPLLDPT